MLQAFEEYLRKHLRASDIAQDSDGIFLFNVNQVAYLVEGCQTKDQQKATKKRIQESMLSINAVVKKCGRTGNGMNYVSPCMHANIQTQFPGGFLDPRTDIQTQFPGGFLDPRTDIQTQFPGGFLDPRTDI
jgi:hypothetical protein